MEKDDERGCRIPPQRPEWREERQSPPTQGEIVRVSPQLTRPQAGEEEGAEVTSSDRPCLREQGGLRLSPWQKRRQQKKKAPTPMAAKRKQQHEEADDEAAQHGEASKTAPSG